MQRLTLVVPNETVVQQRAQAALEETLRRVTPGYSWYFGIGEWNAPGGERVREQHRRYEILGDEAMVVRAVEAFREYGRAAGESTLLWWNDEVNARFEEVEREAVD